MFKTSEITAYTIDSDNVLNQRLLFAYQETAKLVSGNMLETGCGVGKGLALFPANCDHYTTVDKNKALIVHLSRQYPQYTFICRSIPPLTDFADNTFDTVVSQQVIEHLVDDNLYVKEVYRVLKPGGKFILTTPNRLLSLTRNPWHVREYTATELQALLAQYFKIEEFKGITGSSKVWDYYAANKESVKKIIKLDILNLQYRLPRQLLQVPYDLLNRINRERLKKQDTSLVGDVKTKDYFFTDDMAESLDFFAIATK
ncbi:MAG: class I SAM-dependent methyltransferase [Bernardetiaceae bacterium]|nr:class I SAM-dependent methyltransferase [Bernardetiaceae bacterium]